MLRILLAFAAGYMYCQMEHHPITGVGVWAAVLGLGMLLARLVAQAALQPVAKRIYREAQPGKLGQFTHKALTPVWYWLHHFNRHEDFSYKSCGTCNPH